VGAVYLFDMTGKMVHEFGYDEWTEEIAGFGESLAMSNSDLVIGTPYHDGGAGRVDWYDLADLSCRTSLLGQNKFGAGVALSGELIAASYGYYDGEVAAAVFNTERDFLFELVVNENGFEMPVSPAPGVAILEETVLVADSGSGVLDVPKGMLAHGAASKTSSGSFNRPTASHASSRSVPSKRPKAPKLRPTSTLRTKAAAEIGVGAPSYDEYASTGYVFQLAYPRSSEKTLSGQDVVGDDSYKTFNDGFGNSIAASSTFTVIGAPGAGPYDGAVHVYSAELQWERVIYPPKASAEFGFSVALFEDWVLVGAPSQDMRGAAHLCAAKSGEWLYELPIDAEVLEDARFGHSVAFCGENMVAVVGIPDQTYADEYVQNGEVRVFKLASDGAVSLFTIPPAKPGAKAQFGRSVSCYDRYIAVGAPAGGADIEGAVYLYELSDKLDTAVLVNAVTNSDIGKSFSFPTNSEFGASVALTEAWLVIGAPFVYDPSDAFSGAVVAFTREGASLGSYEVYFPGDPTDDAQFGTSVAVDKDLLVVGAPGANGKYPDIGAAYTFQLLDRKPLDKLVQARVYTAWESLFGASVAVTENNVMVGRGWSLDSSKLSAPSSGDHEEEKTRKVPLTARQLFSKQTSAFVAEAADDDGYGCAGEPKIFDEYEGGTVEFFVQEF
jgi:hypothetical protein